jgi:hypothetical protein
VSGQLHVLRALPLGKEPLVPIGQKAGWASEPVWMLQRRDTSFPCWKSNPGHPTRGLSLYRLSYPSSNYNYNNEFLLLLFHNNVKYWFHIFVTIQIIVKLYRTLLFRHHGMWQNHVTIKLKHNEFASSSKDGGGMFLWNVATRLQGVINQTTTIWIFTAVKTSNLIIHDIIGNRGVVCRVKMLLWILSLTCWELRDDNKIEYHTFKTL